MSFILWRFSKMQFIKCWNTDMGKTNYYVIHIGVLIFPVGWWEVLRIKTLSGNQIINLNSSLSIIVYIQSCCSTDSVCKSKDTTWHTMVPFMCLSCFSGVINKQRDQNFEYFWPPPSSWSLLLNKAYVVKSSFG